MSKWIKAKAGGYVFVDVDYNIWCPCDEVNVENLYCQDGNEVTCPKCGKKYRVITRVTLQEKEADDVA